MVSVIPQFGAKKKQADSLKRSNSHQDGLAGLKMKSKSGWNLGTDQLKINQMDEPIRKGMVMKKLIIATLFFMILGCASSMVWVRGDRATMTVQEGHSVCDYEVNSNIGATASLVQNVSTYVDLYPRCMKAKGFYQVPRS